MVGEIRDGDTAEIAIKAAQTGHLVLSTLHTNSTSETLIRLQQMGVARWMISSALTLVVAQRLVRKLCPHCKQRLSDPVVLSPNLWPSALPRWQASGCQHCYHGFYGRTALFEVLTVTPALRQLIASGASAQALEAHLQQTGIGTLFENGCHAVEQGMTSFEEILRVLGMAPMNVKQLWRWQGVNDKGQLEQDVVWVDNRLALIITLQHQRIMPLRIKRHGR
ncbi:protein transport protein HofB [Salmonella enterica subsp. indica]|uniref:Protein transport protein HofB n=1 Tax=Salmonella enterica subsp. indica TaxID=59207 RepID=A0A379XUA3_SALER|nr:protein transport protein HofB [Salmonella enterica subsp. indica]